MLAKSPSLSLFNSSSYSIKRSRAVFNLGAYSSVIIDSYYVSFFYSSEPSVFLELSTSYVIVSLELSFSLEASVFEFVSSSVASLLLGVILPKP